jgi:hypothetical protein
MRCLHVDAAAARATAVLEPFIASLLCGKIGGAAMFAKPGATVDDVLKGDRVVEVLAVDLRFSADFTVLAPAGSARHLVIEVSPELSFRIPYRRVLWCVDF